MKYTEGERFVGCSDERWWVAVNPQNTILAEFREKGDALLAAASPDMYEAGLELLEALGNPMQIPPYEVVKKFSRALSKAEGR